MLAGESLHPRTCRDANRGPNLLRFLWVAPQAKLRYLETPRHRSHVSGDLRMPARTAFVIFWIAFSALTTRGGDLPNSRDSLSQAIDEERRQAQQWLAGSVSSYLATVGRVDFGERTVLTVGRSPENDVILSEPFVCERHLIVTVKGDSFEVSAVAPEGLFTVSGKPARFAVVGPSAIGLGRLRLRLSHQGFPAIIVFDPESPRFKAVPRLRYYQVDPSYRFVLPLRAKANPDTVVILSTRGNKRRALRVGWFDFKVKGAAQSLEVHRLLEPGVGDELVSVFFTDLTTGSETYPVGRYVDPEPLGDGLFVLDFNRAYNPACAFSDHYNCPIPPEANRLKVAVPAGEMDPHAAGN